MTADKLLTHFILRRFREHYEQFPYSVQAHILQCPSLAMQDVTQREFFACCESCPYVEFTAHVSCEHAHVTFTYEEGGRLNQVLADMAELENSTHTKEDH